MSQIEKLKIQGIRSFDNQNGENIYFTAPLTLIVGYNGSGKTTIIECLKYASTGLLPPNSKGGAFIHDPKLCGEKEVLAQVKLQFRNASNNKCVITRSLSLTVKKATVTQKTLECQLLLYNHGERISLSTRVAELDKIVPEQLGVSRAILESVIFCHQDESLWPMSEPSKLKVKFDEIFEAQKYTKAIDSLTKMKKSHREELSRLVIHEANFKALKDKADKVKKRSLALEAEIDELREKKEALRVEIAEADTLSKQKHEQKNAALGIVNELKTKLQQSEGLESFLVSLRSNLDELAESDEWLSSTLEQYEERMAQYEQQEMEFQNQYRELQEEASSSRQQASNKQSEKGRHQAEKETYEKAIESRVELVKEAARAHSQRGYDGDLEDHQVREFIEKIQKLSQEKDRELDDIRKSMNKELKETQSTLSTLENKQATHTQEKVHAKQAITDNAQTSRSRQQQADSIRMDEGAKAALETSLADVRSLLQRAMSDYEAANWDANLKRENTKLRELEAEEARLRQELFHSTRISKDLAALEFTKKAVKEQQSALDTLISTYTEQLAAIVGPDWRPETLDREFRAMLNRKARTLDDAKAQQDGADREFSNLEFKLKTARASLSEKREEMGKCQSAVLDSIQLEDEPLTNVDSYPVELEKLTTERDEVRKALDGADIVSTYYKEAVTIMKGQHVCRLCRTNFTDDRKRSSALEAIEKLIARSEKEQLKEELDIVEQDLKLAQAARSQYDTYKKLREIEVPTLEKSVQKLESDRAVLLAKCEKLDSVVKEESSSKRDTEALTNTVNSISNYSNDISKNESEIARLSSQQKLTGASMTLTEIKEQSEACDEKLHVLKGKIAKMVSDKNEAITEVNRLEKEEGAASNKVESASHLLEKKQNLLASIDELRESTAAHRKSIQAADAALTALGPQFAKAQAQHDDAQRRGESKAKDVQAAKDKLARTANQFKLIDDSINAYIENGGPGKLAACQRAIKALEQDLKRIEGEIDQVTVNANAVKERRADSERTKRSIVDNIRYRKAVKDLETLKEDIQELEDRNATDDYEEFHREALAADNRRAALQGEVGPVVGSIRALDKELMNLMEEWETDYKDAAEKYREMHVKVETTKAAIDDMTKCSGALDNAIMKYHSMKMEEINAIAGELWRSTYQGTDVDTIMIRSENENPTAKKRNYNYRVVMVKQDAEMDMRGRCSAGQKVLASIIIRLALAECFGINCGVIALDEPTTNLDRDNIKALAESLNQIIKSRKHQSNFQLIIITHDEEFLKEMKCSEFAEQYWRVSRNAEQNSIIERQSLDDLM